MESLVRRGVRTTMAVAGLAALGVGLATPAFADPTNPEVSGLGNVPAAAGTDQLAGVVTALTEVSNALAVLPGLFGFEMPPVTASVPTDGVAAAESSQSTEPSTASTAPGATTPAPASASAAQAAETLSSLSSALPVAPPQVRPATQLPNTGSALQSIDGGNSF